VSRVEPLTKAEPLTRAEPPTRVETSGVPRQKAARWQTGAERRTGGTFLFGLVLGGAVLASGCGGSSPSASVAHLGTTTTLRPATGSTGPSGKSNDGPLAYAQCMRAHGIPGFPDPNAQGGFSSGGSPNSDLNPDSPGFQNANADCQRFTPTSGIGHGPSPAQIAQAQAQALKFSECMRSHGVADFPDPVFHAGGGGINISIKAGQGSDLSPSSPAFQAAEQACQNVFPGSKRGSRFVTKGPAAGGSSSGGSGIAGPSTGG
jgi:hypothetical protein